MTAPALLPPPASSDADALLDAFLGYCARIGIELYPAQEEAVLEVFAGRDVVLHTPTGSGKSLVGVAVHLRALARGERSAYTSPIKALVSEKFFALCAVFGPERVGMLTGDGAVNPDADVICCTAEVLAMMALRQGPDCPVRAVVVDEVHYAADAARGTAWQVPLLVLVRARFLLMSATLGDPAPLAERLRALTGQEAAIVRAATRPVPLHYAWSDAPLFEAIEELVRRDRAPLYVVNFSQREAGELAQSLASTHPADKERRLRLREAVRGFRFDSPYGRKVRAMIEHGVGVHHGGLLPKYRRLVERLAGEGLLRVIAGTDTLGVGVNVPIRCVLFTRLHKFDGERSGLLSARDFHQIAGRAGRKGFDTAGYVVCQAPAHVVENRRAEAKVAAGLLPKKKLRKEPPPKDYVPYDEATFARLCAAPPEPLVPRFDVDVGMLLLLMQRDPARCGRDGGFGLLLDLIEHSPVAPGEKARLAAKAEALLGSLVAAGVVVEAVPGQGLDGPLTLREGLGDDFSVQGALGLFLLDAAARLPADDPEHHLRVVTLAEATLENPRPILFAQRARARGEKVAELKAEGLDYEDRMAALDDVSWPQPDKELVWALFDAFAAGRPWLQSEHVRVKSIARDLILRGATFSEYVRDLRVETAEGVLLRYLAQTWRLLDRSLPDALRTDALVDATEHLRAAILAADSSLLSEWEELVAGVDGPAVAVGPPPKDLRKDVRRLRARIRAELAVLVAALAEGDWEAAEGAAHPASALDAAGYEEALRPFFQEFGRLRTDHAARLAEHLAIAPEGGAVFSVRQRLLDPEGEGGWALVATVDLREDGDPKGPLLRVASIEE